VHWPATIPGRKAIRAAPLVKGARRDRRPHHLAQRLSPRQYHRSLIGFAFPVNRQLDPVAPTTGTDGVR
jgi:hypothetical protein